MYLLIKILPVFYFAFTILYIIRLAPTFASGTDFLSYYTGAQIIKDGKGDKLYDLKTQHYYQSKISNNLSVKMLPYLYLPFAALVFIPLTYVSYYQGYILFLLFNIFLTILFIYLSRKIFTHINDSLIGASVLFSWPLFITLFLGQTSLLLSLSILLSYWFAKQKKFLLAGITFPFILLKFQYILLLPFLIVTIKNPRFLIGLALGFLVVAVINLLFTGLPSLLHYPLFLKEVSSSAYGNDFKSFFTLYATLDSLSLYMNIKSQLAIINVLGYFLTFVVFFQKMRKRSLDEVYIFASLIAVIFSIHAHTHDLVLWLVPIFITIDTSLANKRRSVFSYLIITTLFLIPFASLTKNVSWTAPLLLLLSLYIMVFPLDPHSVEKTQINKKLF